MAYPDVFSFVATDSLSASVTGGSASAALAEYWIRDALTNLPPDLVMMDICKQGGPGAWKQIPTHEGKKVHFYRLPVLAANTTALDEVTGDPTAVTANLEGVTAEIKAYGDFMRVSDQAQKMLLKPATNFASQMMAQQGVRSFDNLIYETATGGATTAYCGAPTVTAVTTLMSSYPLKLTDLEYLAYTFKKNNVRTYPNGRWKYKADPYTIKDLRAQTGTREAWNMSLYLRDEATLRGVGVGSLAGFEIMETTEIVSASANAALSAEVAVNLACGYESVGAVSIAGNFKPPQQRVGNLRNRPRFKFNMELIYKDLGSAGADDPLDRRATVGYKFWTAVVVLDALRVYKHYCFFNQLG